MLIIISFYNHSELIKEELFYRSEHLQRPSLDRPIEFMNIYYCYMFGRLFVLSLTKHLNFTVFFNSVIWIIFTEAITFFDKFSTLFISIIKFVPSLISLSELYLISPTSSKIVLVLDTINFFTKSKIPFTVIASMASMLNRRYCLVVMNLLI